MRSVKSHKALLLEEVIRLAYGLHCFGFQITSERTNKHRACIYKCANSLSGNPWNPFSSHLWKWHFYFRRKRFGVSGEVSPDKLPGIGGTQMRCLRLHGTLKKRTNISVRKEPQMSTKNPRKRPCRIDLHITIDERNDIRSKSDIGGLDL